MGKLRPLLTLKNPGFLVGLKLWPREVAEVVKVQTKKFEKKIEFLKSSFIELHKRYIPQKKAMNNRHLYLKQNQRLFLLKKIEKKVASSIFDPKKLKFFVGLG